MSKIVKTRCSGCMTDVALDLDEGVATITLPRKPGHGVVKATSDVWFDSPTANLAM